jgi:hypothetical protein
VNQPIDERTAVETNAGAAADAVDTRRLAARNRSVGWTSMAVGVGAGLLLGMWSFDGPLAVPEWLGAYDATSRRLVRLGHIAFIGLGILDVLLARELPQLRLSARWRRIASGAMILGNVLLPPVLVAAGAWRPLKYLMSLPATAVFVALVVAAIGARKARDD